MLLQTLFIVLPISSASPFACLPFFKRSLFLSSNVVRVIRRGFGFEEGTNSKYSELSSAWILL
jgi:hypothetical protein